jgi:hypothetical protein
MLGEFIVAQNMFFNASAPNQRHIYVSRKDLDTFRIPSDTRLPSLDPHRQQVQNRGTSG